MVRFSAKPCCTPSAQRKTREVKLPNTKAGMRRHGMKWQMRIMVKTMAPAQTAKTKPVGQRREEDGSHEKSLCFLSDSHMKQLTELHNYLIKIKKFWGKCKSLPQWGCDIVKLSCTVHVLEEGLSFSHEGNEVIRKRQQYEWNACKERQTLMESDEVRHCGMKTMTWKHDNWGKKNKIK